MNLRQFVVEQANQFVVLFDRLQRLYEHGLAAGAGAVHHALHPPLLFDLYRDDKALAADGHQFILCCTTFGQLAQVSAKRFLNHALLLFNFAANPRELR